MVKRFLIASIILAIFIGGLGYFQLVFKPQMIKDFLSKQVPPPATVTTEAARSDEWVEHLPAIGTLISSQGVDIASQVAGIVTDLGFESGQEVPQGELLVQLDISVELADLAFAWKAAKHIKSNAIVMVKDRTLVGMGAGQPNRVVSVHLSQRTAGDKAKGSVLASDAFFPFPDNIELAAAAGVTAIVQPGGSIRDDDVIAAANQHNLAMVFTGVRHFRH